MSDAQSFSNEKNTDVFSDRFKKAREFWVKVHDRMNYNYLMYRSILTYNQIYGEKYLAEFGLQVFVPRTFMTIESLAASENARKIEFTVEGTNFKSAKRTKYVQKMDNSEFRRSHTDTEVLKARKDSEIFGNGYIESLYVEDVKIRHIPLSRKEMEDIEAKKEQEKLEKEMPEVPEMTGDANAIPFQVPEMDEQDRMLSQVGMTETSVDEATGEVTMEKVKKEEIITDSTGMKWRKQELIKYRGMKGVCLNPYYVFYDPDATSDEDAQDCFVYKIMATDVAREYVVSRGWMKEDEAKTKIQPMAVEVFDGIRETIDWMYKVPITPWSRGDHSDPMDASVNPSNNPRDREDCVAIIERWTEDTFEARLGDATTVLFSGFNTSPKKEIPIIPFWDYTIPHEFVGMGEPEVIRHQQVEENKLHNFLLQAVLQAVSQRYAINVSYLEDETDAYFVNPFRPIRMKPMPGTKIEEAIMALPQPDVKRTPFELMDMVRDVLQKTTGANDFVVSASQGTTDTATESNNLVAATSTRVKERLRGFDYSLCKMINQWHPCYFTFYDEEMDVRITGKEQFWKYMPLDREEANENPALVTETQSKMDAVGSTVAEVYKNAGYEDVIYLSDLIGEFEGHAEISDPDQNEQRTLANFRAILDNLILVNKIAAEQGIRKRYDVFKVAEDMIRNISLLGNSDDYVMDENAMTEQAQMQQMQAMKDAQNQPPVPPGAQVTPEPGVSEPEPAPQSNSPFPEPTV